jgi:glutaredoxin 2
MCENNRESVEKMGEQMDKFLSVLEDADQRIKDLTARVRTLENLIGGNMVREGYN